MAQHVTRLDPALSDAAITFVPERTDEQLVRVARALAGSYPHALVGGLTDFTAISRDVRSVLSTSRGLATVR